MNRFEVRKKYTLSGHQNPIFAVESGSARSTLFTAGNDKGVVEWDLESGKFTKILLPVKSSVYSLHRIPSSNLLTVGERSGLVTIVDFEKQHIVARLQHHEKPVFGIQAFSTKTEMIVSSEDGTLSVWDTTNFKLLYHFSVSKETVRCIALNRKEDILAVGSKDSMIRIFQAADYSRLQELDAHSAAITSLTFSPDDEHLLTGGRDAQLNIFETGHFQLKKNVTAHMFSIYGIVYHPSLPLFLTASRDKSIKIWRANDYSLIKNISLEKGYESHRLSINNISWIDDQTFVSVSDDKTAIVWEINLI
ncbi:WD40 repeat domain-containing protein [Olivibacter sp. XZL3]|uniref:WD40 repeat domain-containing protein n=1 Tax=Olivibacter sp. XZL3 TaxID=1735116 RepID=UPI0010647A1A|nr:WD40 repeat domain-containing protein [Olivibacter sp. XZL3]